MFSYIDVKEFDTQVIIREELLLAIYEQFEAAGISLAFPAQTILHAPKNPPPAPADDDGRGEVPAK